MKRLWAKTTYLINDLIVHEGKGGLYTFLKRQGLIDKIFGDDSNSQRGVLHQYVIDIRMTDKGMAQFQYVSACLFQFLSFALAQLKTMDSFSLFDEVQTMSLLSFDFYKIPDALENVQCIADEMVMLANHPERYSKLLRDAYNEAIVDHYDMD